MDEVFQGIDDTFIYLDYILIASKDTCSYYQTLKEVLEILLRNQIKINLKKFKFLENKTCFWSNYREWQNSIWF